eukprot:Rhum_TRINITY_DN3574_c0_g1::Rhum_TRINITY_DN3574_c0_g1_i1::g.11312::m.11312
MCAVYFRRFFVFFLCNHCNGVGFFLLRSRSGGCFCFPLPPPSLLLSFSFTQARPPPSSSFSSSHRSTNRRRRRRREEKSKLKLELRCCRPPPPPPPPPPSSRRLERHLDVRALVRLIAGGTLVRWRVVRDHHNPRVHHRSHRPARLQLRDDGVQDLVPVVPLLLRLKLHVDRRVLCRHDRQRAVRTQRQLLRLPVLLEHRRVLPPHDALVRHVRHGDALVVERLPVPLQRPPRDPPKILRHEELPRVGSHRAGCRSAEEHHRVEPAHHDLQVLHGDLVARAQGEGGVGGDGPRQLRGVSGGARRRGRG